jgi:hypothetical protein
LPGELPAESLGAGVAVTCGLSVAAAGVDASGDGSGVMDWDAAGVAVPAGLTGVGGGGIGGTL